MAERWTVDREFELLAECCRAAFDPAAADVQRAARDIRWEQIPLLAARHRVQGLFWTGVQPIVDGIPPEVANLLRDEATKVVRANMRMARECSRLQERFEGAGLPIIFLKGLSLGALCYGDPFVKMGWDIDMLVRPDQLAESARLMRQGGYDAILPATDSDARVVEWHERRKESVWRSREGGIYVELHSRVADHPRLLPGLTADSPSQRVAVAPGVNLPTFASDELFAYLCVHGASSAWFRLKWITDLGALVKDESDLGRLHRRSLELGAGRAGGQALLLANRLYGTKLSQSLATRLQGDRATGWLAELALRELNKMAEPTETPLGTAAIHLAQLMLVPGPRFAASEAWRQLRDMTNRGGA